MKNVLLLLLVLIIICDAAIPKKQKNKKYSSVRDKGLVVAGDVSSTSILNNYNEVNLKQGKTFSNPTLGFVTPWFVIK